MFESVKGYQVEIPEIPGTVACAGRRLRALREGYTVLMVRYEQCLPNGKEETLEASVTIVAFPPLIVGFLITFPISAIFWCGICFIIGFI